MASIGSTSIATESGVSIPTIDYLNLTLAANEYSYTFPANCKEYWFVNWSGGLIEYGYTLGGNKMPLHLKESREKIKLKLNGSLTVYFQGTIAGGLVKIEYWI